MNVLKVPTKSEPITKLFILHIILFDRSYARCSAPKPWEDDGIKAYALCPWFANTDLLKESTNIKELEKDTMFRVLTVKDVGNAFEE